MTSRTERTRALYNDIGPQYSKVIERQAHTAEIEKFLALVQEGASILDVGCAAGRDTKIFRSKGYQVTGIDVSETMISLAEKNSPGTTFIHGDMLHLPLSFPDFDAIWCTASLDHLEREDIPKALAEFARVLKKGGVLFLATRKGEGILKKTDRFSQDKEREFTLVMPEEITKMLQKAGFSITQIYDRPSSSRPDMIFVDVFARKD